MGEGTVMQHTLIQVLKIEYNTMEEAKRSQGQRDHSRAGNLSPGPRRMRVGKAETGMFRNGELSHLAGAQCTWEKQKW